VAGIDESKDVDAAPVKVAIVGMGLWGARAHLPAFSERADVEVVALVDPAEEVARRLADEHQVPWVYPDVDALFADCKPLDAAVFATPTDTHYELVLKAFDAGVHVLCEKPLAYDVPQARQMLKAARKGNFVTRMGFLFRESPSVRRIKQLVDDGFLGQLQLFEMINVNAQFADPQRPVHWKMRRARANGGVFVEYGSHSIDLAQWFGGPITRVVAHGVTLVPQRPAGDGEERVQTVDVDGVASWIAVYESGAEALVRSGWASLPVGGGGVRLYGTRGSLAWQNYGRRMERVVAANLDQPEPRVIYEFAPPFDSQVDEGVFPLGLLARYNRNVAERFVQDVRNGEATAPGFQEGLAVQEVLAAIRTSLDERRWVDVDRAQI
jgi:predicted dehydrogenase